MERKKNIKTIDVPEVVARKHEARAYQRSSKQNSIESIIARLVDKAADADAEMWDELCQLAGYADLAALWSEGLCMRYDRTSHMVTIYEIVDLDDWPACYERLADAWAEWAERVGPLYSTSREASRKAVRHALLEALNGRMPEETSTTNTDG